MVERHHKALIKLCSEILNAADIIELYWHFKSVPASKIQEQFLSRETLSLVAAHLPSIANLKVCKVRTGFRLYNTVFFLQLRSEEAYPSMHCDHALKKFCELVTDTASYC